MRAPDQKLSADQNENELLCIYEKALESRFLDEELQRKYHATRNTTAAVRTNFSGIGNEVGPSIVTTLSAKEDFIVPRYRGYAAVLGRGAPIERIAGDMFKKRSGTSKGIGDISSFRDPEHNISGYSTVLGTNFSIALGIAFSLVYKGKKGIVVHFFGDGEATRTTFGAALNLASLWKLPILFVCENNGVSIYSKLHEMSATKTIAARAAGYAVESETIVETEPLRLYSRVKKIISEIRAQKHPFLIEILQTRFVSHFSEYDIAPFDGSNIPVGKDPLILYEKELLAAGVSESALEVCKQKASVKVKYAIESAESEEILSEEEFLSLYL